ncbi:MAG: ATP-binding cassette domain-containing protein [Candidatus Ancaeobacter aquaticus]|nr:ATP-binding cassette domain-containing protein [Candidatus Ancaeobacter aquaticus]
MSSVIHVNNVSKSYKDVHALSHVSLTVRQGQIFGLIGPDGAGKSTLIHTATGVLQLKEGEITVLGKNVSRDPEGVKSVIGFLPQGLGLSLAAELSIEENIDYFAEINHVQKDVRDQRKKLLLESTQLDPFRDREAKNLSGGMKQKLALCCTLIHEPELIFLDEPTTGVDPISRRDIWTLINTMVKEKGLTVFLTTSYMDEAARCHQICLMHRGKVIAEGTPDTLPLQLEGSFIEASVANQHEALRKMRDIPGIKVMYAMGDKLNIIYEGCTIESIVQHAGGVGVVFASVTEGKAGIEDVFLSKITEGETGIKEKAFDEFFSSGKDDSVNVSCQNKQETDMIVAEKLEKKFGKFVAVNRIDFNVKQGEIFGFLGPNGAGKTTTIKMLCGLYPPSSGKGIISGLDLFKNQFKIKESIGYMSQKFSLYRDLTVAENIELYGGIYGVESRELKRRRDLILQIADLEGEGDTITGSLPMGIKQRLALGCAIIHKPRCIFLDEPTSGVDPIARRKFWDVIYYLSRKMGVTILVTTHYMDEAEHCDRLSLMTHGNIVALGTSQGLKDKVNSQIGSLLQIKTNDVFASVEILKPLFPYCSVYGPYVHLYTHDETQARKSIQDMLLKQNIEIKDIRSSSIPFEDVFVYFCEHSQKTAGITV